MSEVRELSDVVAAVLRVLPEPVRTALVSDEQFIREYDLSTDAVVSIGNGATSIRRSELFAAIRSLEPASEREVSDLSGLRWTLVLAEEPAALQLLLKNADVTYRLPDLSALLPDPTLRLSAFDLTVDRVNLPRLAAAAWREILSSRPLRDDELASLQRDIADTPIRVSQKISSHFTMGEASISTLVPTTQRYYERLVGPIAQSEFEEHVEIAIRPHMSQLVSWRPFEGMLAALVLCSHPHHAKHVPAESISQSDLHRVYEWLQEHGDLMSQVGALEVGFRLVASRPELEPYLIEISRRIVQDDCEQPGSRFRLLAALFSLISGEMAQAQLFTKDAPYWRRLAALAHACIVERCITTGQVEFADFADWALEVRASSFHVQALCDLRREPRWVSEFASPTQLKAELVGRVASAAQVNVSSFSDGFRETLFGEVENSLRLKIDSPAAFLPGPLEGALKPLPELPSALSNEIQRAFSADELEARAASLLVNSSFFFRLDESLATLAASALRTAKHHLKNIENDEELVAASAGLALVAATTRSTPLADEVLSMVRRHRVSQDRVFDELLSLKIGLVAAASRSDMTEWCNFVGRLLTELAFSCSKAEIAQVLREHLRLLCRCEPALWTTCGRAEAALSSFLHDRVIE